MAGLLEAFRQELSKLGWIEGKNFTIEYRFAENKGSERLPELAADLVRLKVDVIVAASQGAASAKKASTTIPIVMTRCGPRGCGSGCGSGAAGRQCYRALGFIARAK